MTRRTALTTLVAVVGSRMVAQQPSSFLSPSEDLTYHVEAKRITLRIDGRSVTFTAKELADALDAKPL